MRETYLSILLHALKFTDDVPHFYCTSSALVIMCLNSTAHSLHRMSNVALLEGKKN